MQTKYIRRRSVLLLLFRLRDVPRGGPFLSPRLSRSLPSLRTMRFFTSFPHAAGFAALSTTTGLMLPRRLQPAAPAEPHGAGKPLLSRGHELRSSEDPHLWLEEVEGEAALEWCKEQNMRAVATIGDPHASDSYSKILAIADSKDKIPHVGRIGGRTGDEEAAVYYNFWQDADNMRGVWRRTSLRSYRSAQPSWETVG